MLMVSFPQPLKYFPNVQSHRAFFWIILITSVGSKSNNIILLWVLHLLCL